MKPSALAKTLMATAVVGWGLARPSPAAAHCDSMDGPVVTAAKASLAEGRVEFVLAWVRPQDEPLIRDAFQRTMKVRTGSEAARELADLWFFETVVRVHRDGEGEPYTGLKPAGQTLAPGVAAADAALDGGTAAPLASEVSHQASEAITTRFESVLALKDHDPSDFAAARAFVHAYVEYIHFVEGLVAVVEGHGHAGEGHPASAAGHGSSR